MKDFCKKFISCSLALTLSFGVVSSSVYASAYMYQPDPSLVSIFETALKNTMVEYVPGVGAILDTIHAANAVKWDKVGNVPARELENAYQWYNTDGFWGSLINTNPQLRPYADFVGDGVVHNPLGSARIVCDNLSGSEAIARIALYDGTFIVDANGNFPYCPWSEYVAYKGGSATGITDMVSLYAKSGTWVDVRKVNEVTRFVRLDEDVLGNLLRELLDRGSKNLSLSSVSLDGVKYRVIMRTGDSYGHIFANANGWLYVSPLEPAAADLDFTYIGGNVVEGDDNSTHTEINGDTTINLPGVNNENVALKDVKNVLEFLSNNNISVTFDTENNLYEINTYDVTQQYDTTNNYYYYEYNYYTYNVQYTYNNTYVTYIGSTAEFVPTTYELYYELPDGRSSADLTEADIAGLSFQFHDVVNYKRSATDTSLRALYHFDGDTDDSSYWSTQGAFTWDKGASITYMESNAFNGALYLDEKEHQFTITLPSSIGSQDFTLQWRYYQNSATTTDHNENYVTVGGQKLLGWSEQSLYSLGTTKLSTGLSVGTWQELALVRHNGTLFIYHNGVKIASASMPTVFNDKIVFYLGANSRSYSMLDELRVVNFAIVKSGAAYTPTVVPYDTNSVLVLPDGAFPIADEYWVWDTKITPLYSLDMTTGFLPIVTPTRNSSSYIFYQNWSLDSVFCESSTYFKVYDGFCVVPYSAYHPATAFNGAYDSDIRFTNISPRVFLPVASSVSGRQGHRLQNGKVYTFSVILRDGTRHSSTVTLDVGANAASSVIELGPLAVYVVNGSQATSFQYLSIGCVSSDEPAELVYLEVVSGEQPNTDHKFVTAVYSSDELQANTAAIQSDIPVQGYTVGGVRPTFPVRGDVWMPVEGSRITGVQIYNGRAWEETNARYWTGSRWIPIYAFDLVTLQDMWDVSSSTGEDVSPPISSEYGFWNWWQKQWLDFRAWLEKNGGTGTGPGMIYPDQGTCEHTHVERVLTQPTCTTTGTGLYVCTKCGDSYVQTIPANGHDWLMEDSILDELDEDGAVVEPGYDLYRCSACGEEYKDFARTGPPGETDGSSLTQLIQHLFETLGELVGSLISWVLDLGTTAMDGFSKVGEFFEKTAGEIKEFGGEFAAFLGSFFGIIPPELMSILSLAVLLLGLGLFIRHVLL